MEKIIIKKIQCINDLIDIAINALPTTELNRIYIRKLQAQRSILTEVLQEAGL